MIRKACFCDEGIVLACLKRCVDSVADHADGIVTDIVAGIGVPVAWVSETENNPLGRSVTGSAT